MYALEYLAVNGRVAPILTPNPQAQSDHRAAVCDRQIRGDIRGMGHLRRRRRLPASASWSHMGRGKQPSALHCQDADFNHKAQGRSQL